MDICISQKNECVQVSFPACRTACYPGEVRVRMSFHEAAVSGAVAADLFADSAEMGFVLDAQVGFLLHLSIRKRVT